MPDRPKLLGFQIVDVLYGSDDPPPGMHTYEIYPLAFVLDWFADLPDEEKPNWRLLPCFEDDVEEPTFPKGPETYAYPNADSAVPG